MNLVLLLLQYVLYKNYARTKTKIDTVEIRWKSFLLYLVPNDYALLSPPPKKKNKQSTQEEKNRNISNINRKNQRKQVVSTKAAH